MDKYAFYSWLSEHGWHRDYFYMSGQPEIWKNIGNWNVNFCGSDNGKYTFNCKNEKTGEILNLLFNESIGNNPCTLEKLLFEKLSK